MDIKWTIAITMWKYILSMKRSIYRLMKSVHNYYLGFIVLILFFISVYMLRYGSIKEFGDFVPPEYQTKIYPEIGCQFPDLNPFSEIAMRFNEDLPKVVCHGEDWVECNMSKCKVTQHILDTTRDIVCHYKDIRYVNDHMYTIAEPVTLHGNAVYNLNSSDGFKVSCTGYDKGWLTILAKRWFGYKAGIRPLERTPQKSNDTINILIIAFDSMSRNGFIRKMQKSYRYLVEEMKAVILKGYNIVGDGTSEALFPILSGRTDLQHPYARTSYTKDVLLDPDLFIFHTAKLHGLVFRSVLVKIHQFVAGTCPNSRHRVNIGSCLTAVNRYETAYLEDTPWGGSFQYRYNGFSRRPADHYLRSFLTEESKNGNKWWKGIKSRYCIGSTPQYLFLLNLTRQFMNIKTKRFCFTFIADISHDELNLVSTADEDLVNFLKHVKLNMLEDTLVIVMGDHGPRFSPMRAMYEGKMEERLPLMSIILPERLKRQRQDALYFLKSNAAVLTTPFDIHTTILDAMGLEKYASDFVVPHAEMKRGLSFLKSIPLSRSCASAGVLPHWCACMSSQWRNVPTDAPLYNTVVNGLVNFINNFTAEKRELCAKRKLTLIQWVVVNQEVEDLSQKNVVYYQTLIIMSPGRAVFEASMQYDANNKRLIITEKDISRISAYGSEPACVSATHPHLNKYCYCKNKLFEVFNLKKYL